MSEEKETKLEYGNLPAKEAEDITWDIFLVDLIISYNIIKGGHNNPLILKVLLL